MKTIFFMLFFSLLQATFCKAHWSLFTSNPQYFFSGQIKPDRLNTTLEGDHSSSLGFFFKKENQPLHWGLDCIRVIGTNGQTEIIGLAPHANLIWHLKDKEHVPSSSLMMSQSLGLGWTRSLPHASGEISKLNLMGRWLLFYGVHFHPCWTFGFSMALSGYRYFQKKTHPIQNQSDMLLSPQISLSYEFKGDAQ